MTQVPSEAREHADPQIVEVVRSGEPDPVNTSHIPREGVYWVIITGGLILVGLYKGINLLLLLAYLMLGLLVVNIILARRVLQRIRAQRALAGPVFVDQPIPWRVEIVADGRKSVRGWALEDRGALHQLAWFVLRMPPGRTISLRTTVTLRRRGRYRCGPLRGWSRYPFGLLHQCADLSPPSEFIVLPRLGIVHGDRLRHWLARATRGDGRIHRRIRHVAAQEADIHGLRVFRPGDSPRWIHWKTSARRNEWMVREFEDSAPPHLILAVEPWRPQHASVAEHDRLEQLISLAASVCREWCREPGSRLTLVLARPDPVIVDGSTGPEHAIRTLEALAVEEGGSAIDPTEWLMRLGRLTSTPVMVLSSRTGTHLADKLVRMLGRPVARVQADETVPWYVPPGAGGKALHAQAADLPRSRTGAPSSSDPATEDLIRDWAVFPLGGNSSVGI